MSVFPDIMTTEHCHAFMRERTPEIDLALADRAAALVRSASPIVYFHARGLIEATGVALDILGEVADETTVDAGMALAEELRQEVARDNPGLLYDDGHIFVSMLARLLVRQHRHAADLQDYANACAAALRHLRHEPQVLAIPRLIVTATRVEPGPHYIITRKDYVVQ